MRVRVREPPGYECLHGVTGLGIGHRVDSRLLVDMMSALLLLHLLPSLTPHWALLSAALLRGRGGGWSGRDVRVGDLQAHVAALPLSGRLLLTLSAVRQELRYRLPGYKCVLVRYLQHYRKILTFRFCKLCFCDGRS